MKQIFISSIFVFAVALIGCKKSEDGKVEVVPLAPTELKATLFSKDQIDLSWKDNSTNETGYKIERKTDSGVFTEIGSSNTDITTYSDKTVSLNTNYTYRVYSFNQVGKSINYSNEVSIKTLNIPTLTDNSTNIMLDATQWAGNSSLSFSVFGQISSDGGSPLISKGIVWGTSSNPTIDLSTKTIVVDFHTPNSFTGRVSGLALGTKYYIRTYASNIAGTAYGPEKQFTTDNIPVITTNDITNITSAGAKSGGNISSDGRGSGTLAWTNITSRGVVWGTSINPTIALSTKTSDGTGTGSFESVISGLAFGTKYYLRSYATNSMGTGYGNEISITTINGPAITTTSITDITSNGAKSGGTINSDGGSPILARGVVWGTSTNPTIALSTKTINGTGTGSFQSVITLLDGIRTYYVRAYATNSAGTAYGNEITFSNNVSSSFIVNTVTSLTGRIWLDRNLGATQVATSSTDFNSYGYWYQWGRGSDGHQNRNSVTTTTLSNKDMPGDGLFITVPYGSNDWRNPGNNSLWQGVNGINNPCPTGYRLPTETEWNAEIATWSEKNPDGAFASVLKLPKAGYRNASGSHTSVTGGGYYWSSTFNGPFAQRLVIGVPSGLGEQGRANGFSCRCIKD